MAYASNTGDTINSDLLAEDLNWLSRSPFREVSADFAPGAELFTTDMTVRVVETKPFAVTAGYDNTGARSTGSDRFRTSLTPRRSAGARFDPSAISSRSAPMVWKTASRPLAGHADYQSHTANAFVPHAAAAGSGGDIFHHRIQCRTTTRSTCVPILPKPGSVIACSPRNSVCRPVGVKSLRAWNSAVASRKTRFSGTLIAEASAEIAQVFAGWSNTIADDGGRTALGVELHLSPGGLTPDNSGAAFFRLQRDACRHCPLRLSRPRACPQHPSPLRSELGQRAVRQACDRSLDRYRADVTWRHFPPCAAI